MLELIDRIRQHELGNKEEAFALYFSLCDSLKEKYGLVDKDFDEKPTKRGKEWLDIHHIMEYELDNIAQRTKNVLDIQMLTSKKYDDRVVMVVKTVDIRDKEKLDKIRCQYPDKNVIFYGLDDSLDELKPYNVKNQLVYANKIEHFLLHYLLDSIRGQRIFSGGPNFLWDNCVALDLYGFDEGYMNNIKANKNLYYSILTAEEITLLYKKLIDWKNWDIKKCSRYWHTFNNVLSYLSERKVSYVEDKEKFFYLLNILLYELDDDSWNEIVTLPFKERIIDFHGTKVKVINHNYYSLDKKTIIEFDLYFHQKSFTVPNNIERIADGAFTQGRMLEQITIPLTVNEMEDHAFFARVYTKTGGYSRIPSLKKIIYKGTSEMWDEKFSNVKLDGIIVHCKGKCISFEVIYGQMV